MYCHYATHLRLSRWSPKACCTVLGYVHAGLPITSDTALTSEGTSHGLVQLLYVASFIQGVRGWCRVPGSDEERLQLIPLYCSSTVLIMSKGRRLREVKRRAKAEKDLGSQWREGVVLLFQSETQSHSCGESQPTPSHTSFLPSFCYSWAISCIHTSPTSLIPFKAFVTACRNNCLVL